MKRYLNHSLQLKNIGYSLLLLAVAIALYQLASFFPLYLDATRNAGNSLAPASIDLLRQMPGKIDITMYASSKDAELGDIEQMVGDFIGLYRRHKPDISLTFVDPVKDAEAMRHANIRTTREMVVNYDGRREHLSLLNEQSLTSALLRLAHNKDQQVMYLEGHGERRLEGTANHDLGEFGRKLRQNGFKLASINLALAQDVPGNGSVLLITQPQTKLLPGEVNKLLRHVDSGGNLLWLLDAEPLQGLEKLADKLGLLLTPGTIVDPDAQKMSAPDNWTLGASYPPHAVTRDFNLITAFPFARALGRADSARDEGSGQADSAGGNANTRWQRSVLIEAAANGWVSHARIPGKPQFDRNRDIPGPFSLAIALQRNMNDREQRIVVVGSGAFLANAYSGNGGNLDLGVNMINWLAGEEHLINTQPRATLDSAITLSKTQLSVISIGFVIALPLLLMLLGGLLWWRRRS